MEDKKICACMICGTEFVKTRHDGKYCSRRCTQISAKRAKRARDMEKGTDCPHNKELICTNRNCESCGWNPVVAQRRSECHGKG